MKRAYLIFIAWLCVTGCEDDIALSTNELSKLAIECELDPSQNLTAKIYETNDFSYVNRDVIVEDAILRLTTGVDEEITFIYDPVKEEYSVPRELHTVRSGQKYNLIAFRESNEEDKYTSQITTPTTHKLEGKVLEYKDGINGQKIFKIKCSIPAAEKGNFFILKFHIFKNYKEEELVFINDQEEPLAFHRSATNGNLLVDLNRLKNKELELTFETNSTIKSTDIIKRLTYTLYTINEATYRYNISKSKQYQAIINNSTVPVISYSNIVNGYGYLGAKMPYADTIAFNK